MDKRFWAILGIIAVFVVGAVWINNNKKGNSSSNTQPSNHVIGSTSTGVKLLEYGDYECPYCGQYYPIVKQVVGMYANQIQFQFRNLPLTQLHPNAFAGARAAEAASLQNQFWQMHDLLYSNQSEWVSSSNPEPIFVAFATQLGLNISKFKTDFSSAQVNNVIQADVDAFNKTGAQEATPTFFLNGKQISPTESIASFQSFINSAIQKSGHTPAPVTTSSTTATTPSSSSSSSSVPNSTSAPQSKQ